MDPLSPLFARFSLSARVFHSGSLCASVNFDRQPGLGYLHVLRKGSLRVLNETLPLGASDELQTMMIDEPSLLFYPRPYFHGFRVDDPQGAELVCALIDFGGGMGNPLLQGLPDILLVPLSSMKGIDTTLAMLFEEAFNEQAGRQAAINRLAEYFLVLLLRYAIDSRLINGGVLAALADPRIAKSLQAMHEHAHEPWTLESLAQLAGMSRASYAAHFKVVTGMTPLDYLTDWRISLTQTLLKRGKPLKMVAPQVGYSSPIALTRVFTRRLGKSPTQWLSGSESIAMDAVAEPARLVES